MSDRWIYRGITAAAIGVALFFIYYLRSITIPIMIAAFFAYLLDPLIDRMEGMKIGRSSSIFILTLLVVATALSGIVLIVPAIESELRSAAGRLPGYFENFKENTLPVIDQFLAKTLPGRDVSIESLIKEGEGFVRNIPIDLWSKILKYTATTFSGTFSLIVSLIGIFIIPLYIYYILKDFDSLKDGIAKLIPERNRSFFIEKFKEVDQALSSFVRGQLLICAILAFIYSAGLAIIGIDLAIVIGLFSGAAFIIPYLGTIIGIIAASAMAFLQFHDFNHILLVLILYGGAQLLEGAVITPKVIGDRMGLHPLAIILAIITGGEVLGLAGMLIAVPAAATIKIFASSALKSYKESPYYLGGPERN